MLDIKSDNFMLGTALVMLGNPEDLHKLTPEDHSLGLVKNFNLNGNKSRTDLTAGRTNDIVFTVTTGADTRGSFEMYEYSAKNLAYALGLDGASLQDKTGGAHTVKTAAAFANGSVTLPLTDGTDLQQLEVGDAVLLRFPGTNNLVVGKTASVNGLNAGAATTATIEVTIGDNGLTSQVPAGTVVTAVNVLSIGSTDVDRDYACKVQGQLANGKWVTLLFPKVRITSGLSMAFGTDNFGNVPMEFVPLKPAASDPGYAEFQGRAGSIVLDSVKSAMA